MAPPLLAGIRVIDATAVVLGPYASQILADMGADVIKLEPPDGDMLRHVYPMRSPAMGFEEAASTSVPLSPPVVPARTRIVPWSTNAKIRKTAQTLRFRMQSWAAIGQLLLSKSKQARDSSPRRRAKDCGPSKLAFSGCDFLPLNNLTLILQGYSPGVRQLLVGRVPSAWCPRSRHITNHRAK